MKSLCILLLAAVIPSAAAFAAADGGSAGSFLYAGAASARAAGLGNSCSADNMDSSGAFFNPSLVSLVKHTEFTFYYTSPMDKTAYDVMSFAIPVAEFGILAFSRVELANDGIERIGADGIKTGDFSDTMDSYMLSYAYMFNRTLAVGISAKLITGSFDSLNAHSFGIDAGLYYDFGGIFAASLAIQNILPPSMQLGASAETYPLNLRLGAALSLLDSFLSITGDAFIINLLNDGSNFTNGRGWAYFRFSGGLELRPFGFTALRAGISQAGPAVGAGITTENFTIDYAAVFSGLGAMHNFGVTARFGLVPTEREKKLEDANQSLEKDKQRLITGLSAMNNEQAYMSALNDYNTGKYEAAAIKLEYLKNRNYDNPLVKKLDSDVQVALNRAAAGAKYDEAAGLLVNGSREKGLAMIRDAEKLFPGITNAKNAEYMDLGGKQIDARDYESAMSYFTMVLAVDPSNTKAVEMLGKIHELLNMMKKK